MIRELYDTIETCASKDALKNLVLNLPEPIVLLGGWAVYLTVTRLFEEENGQQYLGSKDVDVGFHIDPTSSINELRRNYPPALSGSEYMKIVLAGMSNPREQFNNQLEALLQELHGRQAVGAGQLRLLIIGGACDSPELIDFIESKGACIVADGLCFGLRHYHGLIDEKSQDPYQAIADR